MEKNTKKFDVKVILGKDNESVKKVDVNGKIYKRRRNETYQHFMARVAQKQGNGMPFLDYMKTGHYYGYTKEQYKEYVLGVKPANKKLRNKIAAAGTAAVFGVGLLAAQFAPSLVKAIKDDKNSYAKTTTSQSIEENNSKLKKIYNQLAKTENGKKIVKQLQETDKFQENYNKKIAKYPDENGNVLFLKAREVSAVQDISNAENTSFTSLDYDETRFCDYLSAGRQTTRGLYVSEESTGENTLIHDKDTKKEMKNEEDFALSAIKGNKTTAEIDSHYDELMKTGLTYTASGVNTAYLGEGSNTIISQNGASSSKLDEFINKVKTSNEGANKLDSYAKSKDVTKTQRKLIDEAWEEMDKENINVDLKSRDAFDMTTTEKGKRVHEEIMSVSGGYIVKGSGGTYTYITSKGETIKVSRSQAVKQFGESAVKKAEKKADQAAGIPELNKKEEQKKQDLENKADSYEKDYAQGRADGYAGRGKAKNTAGYNAGYANGQKQRQAESEPDEIIKDETETETKYDKEPTTKPSESTQPTQNAEPTQKNTQPTQSTESTQPTRQKVEKVETYESQPENEAYVSKVRTRA